MTLEEQLEAIIRENYKSVREFTNAHGLKYTTVNSVLKRGIMNAGVGTTLKIFNALDLDIESVMTGTLKKREKITPNAPSLAVSPAKEEPAPENSITAEMEELLQSLTQDQAALICSAASRWIKIVKTQIRNKKRK